MHDYTLRGSPTIRSVRGELRNLDSVDAPESLAGFRPSDPQSFELAIAATIGPEGGEGGDLFYFTVCTADWLNANPPTKGFAFLHGHVLVERWDYELVKRAIGDLCLHTHGSNWDEIATKLCLYGDWEFADYREGV